MENSLLASSSFSPRSITFSGAWVGHVPFASWLVKEIKPSVFVELGTYSGNSYFAFCQSIDEVGLKTQCYAVDTWLGDEHSGYYNDDVYKYVKTHNHRHYSRFSCLLRMSFDNAVQSFSDGSIDLLHIDGLHTYEAVKHDFETWMPKLSPDAFVLFHDISIREQNFGVWRLWDELKEKYAFNVEFLHSNGLGILRLGCETAACQYPWLVPNTCEQNSLIDYFSSLGSYQLDKFELRRSLNEKDKQLVEKDKQLISLNHTIKKYTYDIETIRNSKSWRLTAPLRFVMTVLRDRPSVPTFVSWIKMKESIRLSRKALGYLLRFDFHGLVERIRSRQKKMAFETNSYAGVNKTDQICWGILATQHTLFVAHLIAEQLMKHGWSVEIVTGSPKKFNHDMYVIVCPQMFTTLPPKKKRICFQMEQSVRSGWFTQNYLDILKNSFAVLEYSLLNIEFLAGKKIGYPQVYYLPVGASFSYGQIDSVCEKTFDILFYGAYLSCQRRIELLDELKKHFKIHVITEVFGEEIKSEIQRARLVINLHYYDNALLETPRIQECLSLGVPVVSESSQDQDDYPEFGDAVRFFEQGSVSDMLVVVKGMLESPPSPEAIEKAVSRGYERWTFFFGRMLIGLGFLPASAIEDLPVLIDLARSPVVLSLPETIDRRLNFEANTQLSCQTFDGIRYNAGWVGCGLSFSFLARQALKCGCTSLTVMEDDILMPEDMQERLDVVYDYLQHEECGWDIFVGVIADLHKSTKIIKVEKYHGLTFVTIDRMTSMVFNIYTKNVLEKITQWNSDDRDVQKNTIDRFLEGKEELKVVVLLPFLVGHREDLYSTIWGFKNDTYRQMIYESEKMLMEMVERYSADCLNIE